MDCRILRHVTLKADGHIGCDDSIGYKINLGHVSLARGWRIRDVFEGPVYKHVRTSFKEGRVPWPGTCEACDLLSDGQLPTDTLSSNIELLIEPTLDCNISCACCLRKQIVAGGRSTTSLDPAIVRTFMTSCASESIAISQVHYIGWGEPLMHKDFPTLFAVAKAGAPSATHVVTTAGNVDFRESVGTSPLDRIVVSCDGAFQKSYEQYRRGGTLDTAIAFMRDCKNFGDPGVFLEWKYILFEHNDSDAELQKAQDLADEIGVDSLLFIITNSKWASQRFDARKAASVPITSKVARVSPAAAMNSVEFIADGLGPRAGEQSFGFIDRCNVSTGRFLTVEGWAVDLDGSYADRLELSIDRRQVAVTTTSLDRADVASGHATHETFAGPKVGFMFHLPIEERLPQELWVTVVGRSSRYMLGGPLHWRGTAKAMKQRRDLPGAADLIQAAASAPQEDPSEPRTDGSGLFGLGAFLRRRAERRENDRAAS